MNEEEKKAIEYYTNNEYTFGFETEMNIEDFKKALGIEETDEDTFEKHQIRFKTLLNLIEKQKAELDKKDRIIEEMLNTITALCSGFTQLRDSFEKCYCEFINSNEDCCWKTDKSCKDCIKEYFEKKVEILEEK